MTSCGLGRSAAAVSGAGAAPAPLDELSDDDLLTTAEAADFLKIGESTLERDRLTSSPRFPFVRITQRIIRYRVGTLREMVAARTHGRKPSQAAA
jgi:hypothetical protein